MTYEDPPNSGIFQAVEWDQLCAEPEPGSCPSSLGTACPPWAATMPGGFASVPDTATEKGNQHVRML